ncbi:2,3-bisphosphoglycerate-dependent phosphoglycerate mutase [Zhongshania aliphaticivorans]|uniref:2,3-bisphosphoglycerate-dependent phosphoglycerate mutase n=1 Tax=Zhongshania aliphaticivorans TaxID=1470434 RepID=A0A5S9P2W3_9GAMM|nr:histidine phosphatase family protein [Zhongshania aliphaticivorans]CAA0090225.1 2,3-bisphosphoglycerate-dependent phosphoglycerate mutase [Zhongshania aliphaticivorans]CAA0097617.1 2,3-bisphosphoglycerate-dependent phosphoglycerate mutase [Zhongshania aliphaticivorans]
MAEIVVVRHGQAAFASDDYDRLTEVGWEQARLLGEYFFGAEQQFDAVFSGTMRRHRETLSGIHDAFSLSTITLPAAQETSALNEYDFHRLVDSYIEMYGNKLDGVSVDLANASSFYRFLRLALLAWSRDELSNVAEPWSAFEQRVKGILATLSAVKGRVLVVTSGGPVSAMLREALNLSVAAMIASNLQTKNTGVTRYFTRGEQFSLNMFNAVPHLEMAPHRHLISYT